MKLPLPAALFMLISIAATAPRAQAQDAKVDNARPTPAFDASERLAAPALAVFVIGNWGIGGKEQRAISDGLLAAMKRDGASAVLTTGGNFPGSGVASVTDTPWDSRFESMYPPDVLDIPFWATLGDDDYKGKVEAQIAYSQRTLPRGSMTRWRMPSSYWTTILSAQKGSLRVRVVGLDTRDFVIGDTQRARRQCDWLDSVLSTQQEQWTIVLGYHPVYSNGAQGNTLGMHRWIKPLLEKYRVDVFVGGRDHDLQILSPVNGVRYLVSGGGSKAANTMWANNTVFAATNLGFLWIQCNATELLLHVLDRDGSVIFAQRSAKTQH